MNLTPIDLPFKFRQSSLETAKCLFRFRKTIIDKIREPESEVQERGTHFHDLARRYVNYLVASKQESDWGYADQLVEKSLYGQEAEGLFRNWAQSRAFEPASVFATEFQVRLGWDFLPIHADNAVFSGDLDLVSIVGSEAVITDYKSHWGVSDPTTIQSVYYPWLLWKLMPSLTKITFTLDFVRWNIQRSRVFERDQMQHMDRYVENHIRRVIGAWQTQEWPAAVNSNCAYCRLECPLVAVGMNRESVGQIGTDEEARKMGQQMYALQRAYRQMHAALKYYATLHGPVDVGNDIAIGFTKQERSVYDPKTIVRLNEEHGFDKLRALGVSGKEVKRIARNYPEYQSRAKATAKDASGTTFKFWNQIGDPMEDGNEESE